MPDRDSKGGGQKTPAAMRAARLQEALKANLKRRKDQARLRSGTASRDGDSGAEKPAECPETGDNRQDA